MPKSPESAPSAEQQEGEESQAEKAPVYKSEVLPGRKKRGPNRRLRSVASEGKTPYFKVIEEGARLGDGSEFSEAIKSLDPKNLVLFIPTREDLGISAEDAQKKAEKIKEKLDDPKNQEFIFQLYEKKKEMEKVIKDAEKEIHEIEDEFAELLQ